jgi:predicted RNase H-like HicB family nuclease
MEYPALFEPAEEGGFIVTFPDFDWGITQGETEQDAREMSKDALCTMIREHIRKGEILPRPSNPRGRNTVESDCPLFRQRRPLYTWRSSLPACARLNWRAVWESPAPTSTDYST